MNQDRLDRYGPLLLVVMAYIGLTWLNSINIPLSKAPDEYVHFRYLRFMVEKGRLPLTNEERRVTGYKADQPPLYYGLVALATSWIETAGPPTLKMTWDSPQRKLVDLILPRAMIVRTEDETWPYAGIVLAWMMGRWVSILLGSVTIVLVYLISLEIFPGQFDLALAAAATLAFIPCFTYISAVLSDENMLGVVVGLYFWFLVRLIKSQSNLNNYVAVGLLMGLSLITKYSAVVLPLEFLGVLLALVWRQKEARRRWKHNLATAALTASLASGGWFVFQAWYFNRIEEFGVLAGIIRPLIAGDESLPGVAFVAGVVTGTASEVDRFEPETQGPLWTWVSTLFTKFWVIEIFGAQPPYPPWYIVVVMAGVCFIAAFGWWLIWRRHQHQEQWWLGLLLLHLCIFVPIPLLRYLLSGRINDTAQARYLVFSAAPAVGILLAWGVATVTGKKHRPWGLAGLVGMMVALSLTSAYHFYTGFPPPLPIRTAPVLADPPGRSLSAEFADSLLLRGYDWQLHPFSGAPDNQLLELHLYWSATAVAADDYRTEITLRDAEGIPRLRWLSHPAEGRFPTRAWDVGDAVRDTLKIPLVGLSLGEYQVTLRLLDWQDQPVDFTQGDELSLMTLALDQTLPVHTPMLWQAGQPAAGRPTYRYRATIALTVPDHAQAALIDPQGQSHLPLTDLSGLRLFIVNHDWPSGEYQVRMNGDETALRLWVENFQWNFTPPAIQHVVNANFNDELVLLGYDLPQRRVKAGDGIPLVLYWQSLRRMTRRYTIFDRLLDNRQKVWGGYDRLPRETYPTNLWVPTEIVSDGFAIPVNPAAPDGVYSIVIGLYDQADPTAQSLPLFQDGRPLETTSVSLGPIKVGGPPADLTLAPQQVNPRMKLAVALGDPAVISLRGYDLTQQDNTLHLTLYWESLGQTPLDWTTFVHLRNEAGEIVAQKDDLAGSDGNQMYPTSLWDVGEIVVGKMAMPLPKDLSAGEYQLVTGLYNLADGTRLSVPGSTHQEIILTTWRPTQS